MKEFPSSVNYASTRWPSLQWNGIYDIDEGLEDAGGRRIGGRDITHATMELNPSVFIG